MKSRSKHSRLAVVSLLFASLTMWSSPQTLAAPPANPLAPQAAAAPKLKPEEEKALKFLQAIDALRVRLDATVPSPKGGGQLPALGSPLEVLGLVDELEKLLAANAKDPFLSRPENARDIVVDALKMLYRGRGSSTAAAPFNGWNLANRGTPQGLSEIKNILAKGLLDAEGKRRFEQFVEKHDFNDPAVKMAAGFPPQFNIGSDELKAQVLTAAQKTQAAPDYQVVPKIGDRTQTVGEIVQEVVSKNNDEELNLAWQKLNGAIESNHHDKSVAIKNAGQAFPNYFGRDREKRQLINIISKGQKQHFLITGPAGVGKTTLVRALQDAFLKGEKSIRDEKPPIFLELPITSVTNPSDPSVIKGIVANAVTMSEKTGRRVVLVIDEGHVATSMTQNALKSFLTEITRPADGHPKVHVGFLTTSAESQTFMDDTAFSRRFSGLHVNAFNKEDTIKLIEQTLLPRWRQDHRKAGWHLDGISPDAYDYAYRYRTTEQQFAETGTQELLEAAIVAKMNRDTDPELTNPVKKGPVTLDVTDIRSYLQDVHNVHLMPGDPEFDKKFEERWSKFEENYVGNDALKSDLKKALRKHFGQPDRKNVTALAVFGPPGGGKTYGAEQVAEHFFNGAILLNNGGELKNGGTELNKIIGSPPGHRDSELRGELTRMLREHPEGFVWKIEEADYMHQDVIQLLTNIITDKKFKDGRGKEWDASKILIWDNSNIGQELMIPTGSKHKMTWAQYDMRRKNITQSAVVDGKKVEKVRPSIIKGVFRKFIETIVTKSHPGEDTSAVDQEAEKQVRRYTPLYSMPPTRQELEDGAMIRVQKFVKAAKLEHGIDFEIPRETVMKVIDLDQYEFEKGHGYVDRQLEDKLIDNLISFYPERGKKIHVGIKDTEIELDGSPVPSQDLIVSVEGKKPELVNLGAIDHSEHNPWGSNPEMVKRIDEFGGNMGKYVKGNTHIIQDMQQVLKAKAIDWDTLTTFTFLGTSGNGKTQMAKGLARALFDDPEAVFTFEGLTHPWQLSDHLRPPTGVSGHNKVTDFETWFHNRRIAGGGVILLDELLSEIKQHSPGTVDGHGGGKIAVLQALYEFLAERKLKIAGVTYDARAFIPVITGNTLQEVFAGLDDNPETEILVNRILKELNRAKIVGSLKEAGLDAPKVARLGRIYVLGPQPPAVQTEVGKMKLDEAVAKIKADYKKPIDIKVDDRAIPAVVKNLSTVELGMREVETGFKGMIFEPMQAILFDLNKTRGIPIKSIEMKLPEGAETPSWFVNGKEVTLQGVDTGPTQAKKLNWVFKDELAKGATTHVSGLKQLNSVEKTKVTPAFLEAIADHEFWGHLVTGALLSRESSADFISLIPGPGYLGYVRPAQQELVDIEDLTRMLKRSIELEAGHRANHYMGSFMPGGGNDGSQRKGMGAKDDLGRIKEYFDRMVNNSMLPGISESSSEEAKRAVFQNLENILDYATDEVIHVGVKSKKFDALREQLIKNKYLKKEQLDGYIGALNFDDFGYHGKDALFLEKFSMGTLHVLRDLEQKAAEIAKFDDKEAARIRYQASKTREFSSNLLGRVFHEAEIKAAKDPKALKEIHEIKQAVVQSAQKDAQMHPRLAINCSKKFQDLFSMKAGEGGLLGMK